MNRNTIKRIKKMLVLHEPQYESLRSKFCGQSMGQRGLTMSGEKAKHSKLPKGAFGSIIDN